MGRKSRMPRPPEILRKGVSHRDRRMDALIYEQTREIADEIDRRILAELKEKDGKLNPALVDNLNTQEDTDA